MQARIKIYPDGMDRSTMIHGTVIQLEETKFERAKLCAGYVHHLLPQSTRVVGLLLSFLSEAILEARREWAILRYRDTNHYTEPLFYRPEPVLQNNYIHKGRVTHYAKIV